MQSTSTFYKKDMFLQPILRPCTGLPLFLFDRNRQFPLRQRLAGVKFVIELKAVIFNNGL
ncbi:hypothetical protein A7K91_20385 [Paenibacillus oryzae]|uniref:Uncharacterized protein n=1 Tax=Paenibacillus oryzae TaxID=1844972 RepID=A0A1A5YEQ7_9BACL|nr:hypothetical protein A7K91_20385 [Paenibacillus oryzae]